MSPYFITARTQKKRQLLNETIKIQLLLLMRQEYENCQWGFEHWVICLNVIQISWHAQDNFGTALGVVAQG